MTFGKHKGKPIEVLQSDPQYLNWLMAQPWFNENHQNLKTIIVNNFGNSGPSDTPEHNLLQAKFLNKELCRSLVRKINPHVPEPDTFKIHVTFECSGWDVQIKILNTSRSVFVELKPSIADDFPSVLRQCKRRMPSRWIEQINCHDLFTVVTYSIDSSVVDGNEIREMFASSKIHLILMSEIES